MAQEASEKLSKQERRERRRRSARRRRLRTRVGRVGIAGGVLAVAALWAFEHSGRQRVVEAEVIETRLWRHYPGDGTSHGHRSATLRIEGLTEAVLERADGYERGQRVPVWVRHGRISGWPYFLDVAKPGEQERESVRQEATEEL